MSRGSLTLLQVCSLFMDWVFYPFPFFSGLFCCVFPCPDSLAWLCLCGGACGGVLPRWPSFHWPALLSLGHWGVLVLRILGFEFLELCSSSRSLPVVTGSRSFLACWGLPVPLRLGVCLLHLLIPCGSPLWGFCLCFRLWCASGLALPLSSLGSSSRSLFVSDLVGFGGWSLPLVCLCQVDGYLVCFLAVLFSVLFLVTLLSGLGVHAYLAGLDASSSRSPSVLILLVLADLDGSIPWRYSHSSKILFDDLSENIIYYRGISPGKPALLPTGTSVSSPGRF